MKDQHTHDEHCNCTSRRRFMSMAAMGAGMAMIPIGGRALAQADEIVIGGTLAQSGPFQGITVPFERMARAWAERVNARGGIPMSKLGKSLPIRFVFYDDQTNPPTALRFYERMATVDNVNIFIGPFSSFITNAALQASGTHEIPFFMVEANDSIMFQERNDWATTGLAPAGEEYRRTAQLFEDRGGVKTFALLARDNLHENQSMEGFGEHLKQRGFEVVFQEIAPKDIKDFSSIVLRMRQAEPDVVFVEALPPPWNIGFLKQSRSLGLNPKDFIVGHAPVPVIKAMGDSSQNIVSALYSFDGNTPDHKELNAICNAAGFEPWQFAESGIRYVAFRRIQDALERAGTLDPDAVRDAMWDTDLSLYGGEVVIGHNQVGYGTLTTWPSQLQDGEHVSLWPLERNASRFSHKNGQW